MSTFKKISLLFVMLFFVASASFGQANKGWDGTRPEVWKGSRAMVFMYTPFQSNLGSVNAGTASLYQDSMNAGSQNLAGIGVQFFLSPNWSLTGGLNFGTTSTEATYTGGTRKNTGTTLGLAVDFDYHMPSMYSISPYVGLNASFAMLNAKQTTTPTSGTVSTVETKGTGFGAGLNMGFDWYFTPGMSLGGKYTLGFQSNSAPEATVTTTTTTTVKGPTSSMIGTGIMSVMLKVHF
ncbi:MAG: outer membrane beta-barrel protein [Bacteroidetes bacterium]|nr:outer membrane beta-barrel protein [Bacteroidota bacterium]